MKRLFNFIEDFIAGILASVIIFVSSLASVAMLIAVFIGIILLLTCFIWVPVLTIALGIKILK